MTRAGTYQITLVGSGPTPIVDADDLALDGNDDGNPGGNFISQFTVGEVTPTPTPTPTPSPSPAPVRLAAKAVEVTSIRAQTPQSQPVSDVRIEVGTMPGTTPVAGTLTVFLSAAVSTVPTDVVVLLDRNNQQVAIGAKGPNTLTFSGVPVASGSTFLVSKMRVINAAVGPQTAQISLVTVPATVFEAVPPVLVATAVAG
jgi:hypothetical protein